MPSPIDVRWPVTPVNNGGASMHQNTDIGITARQSPRVMPPWLGQAAGGSAEQPLFEQILAMSANLQVDRSASQFEDEPSGDAPENSQPTPDSPAEDRADQRVPKSDEQQDSGADEASPSDEVPVLVQVIDLPADSSVQPSSQPAQVDSSGTAIDGHVADGAEGEVPVDQAAAVTPIQLDDSASKSTATEPAEAAQPPVLNTPQEPAQGDAEDQPLRAAAQHAETPQAHGERAQQRQVGEVTAEQPIAAESSQELDAAHANGAADDRHSDEDRSQTRSRKWWESDGGQQSAGEPGSVQGRPAAEPGQQVPPEPVGPSPADAATAETVVPRIEPLDGMPREAIPSSLPPIGGVVAEGPKVSTTEGPEATRPNPAIAEAGPSRPAADGSRSGRTATAESEQPDVLTRQQQVRLVQRIARSFNRLTPHGGQITLRLHPPQLGALAVRVRIEGRSLEARLTAETSAARDAILENLPALRTRLADQGFEISQFQVDVGNNGSDAATGDGRPPQSDTAFGGSDHQPHGRGQGNHLGMRAAADHEVDTTGQQTSVVYAGLGIDVHA
ncbi:MAG: flagellar hook-length control protein FliK [Planctomycetota bacterium]|nr:MAG: flagellar hook-length control protein FliK [Planctomycetota bacterium]